MSSLKNTWAFIKRNSKKLIFVLLLIYPCMVALTVIYSSTLESKSCKYYTEKLNGGVHTFAEQNYKITLCARNENRDGHAIVRLQIFDTQDELKVERFFDMNWENDRYSPLEYTNSSVIYFDESESDYRKEIQMPPSRWEWLKIKIKHSFWSAMEFIFVKPVAWIFSS
jgi:hypothetical protein